MDPGEEATGERFSQYTPNWHAGTGRETRGFKLHGEIVSKERLEDHLIKGQLCQ